jgi:hypothetical protein
MLVMLLFQGSRLCRDQVTGQRHGAQLLSLLATCRQRRQGGKLNYDVLLARHTPAAEAET